MKKIIIILFLFLSFYTCYIIYNLTENKDTYYLLLGDEISNISYIKNNKIEYNNHFVNEDYRIVDILNIIKYNEEKQEEDKTVSIHQLLKKSDIVILSVGMNDIYSKLNNDTKKVYTYMNNMVTNMELLLKEINKYKYKKVIVLGYYNITNKNNDIFTYLNYKMKRIVKSYNYEYLELNEIFKNKPEYLQKEGNYYINELGYQEINKLIVEIIKKT